MGSSMDQNQIQELMVQCDRYIKDKRFQDALQIAEKLLAMNPQSCSFWNAFGVIQLGLGNISGAKEAFQKALKIDPKYISAIQNMAILSSQIKDYEQAIYYFHKMHLMQPKDLRVLERLVQLCLDAKQWKAVVQYLDIVSSLIPNNTPLLLPYAVAYRELKVPEKSLYYLEQALKNDPENADILGKLGLHYYYTGDIPLARQYYQKTIDRNPFHASALKGMAYTQKKWKEEEANDLLEKLEHALSEGDYSIHDHSLLFFAKGKVLNDIGFYDEAFTCYREGNEMMEMLFDREEFTKRVDKLKSIFTKETFQDKASLGNQSELPVFVVGMPRSGTSLVEQMLASHPKVLGCGERAFFYHLELQHPNLSKLTMELVKRKSHEYLEVGLRGQIGCDRIVDKMPSNFLELGYIALLFPNAKIIHIKRDPYDTCLSCYFQHFVRPGLSWSTDLADIGFFYKKYEELMGYWENILPIKIHQVEYETLIANPEQECRKMIEYMGLEWDDACLQHEQTDRMVHTSSAWQVRQPLNKSSVARWKKYKKHLDPFKREYKKRFFFSW